MIKKFFFVSLLCTSVLFSAFSQQKITKYIDPANMDQSVKPGDDFYRYANGNWMKHNAIPASKTRWGSFDVLREEASKAMKSLLEDAAANTTKNRIMQMTGDFYASGMDSMAIEKLGYTPIKGELIRIGALTSLSEIVNEIATLRTRGLATPLFGFSVGQDAKRVTEYIPQFGQGGTTLPDRDYYLKNDPRFEKIRTEYLFFITDMFALTGVDKTTAQQNAALILALETKIANAQLSRVEMRDPQKLYNKFLVDDFSKTTPHLDWRSLMQKMGVAGQDSIIVSSPAFLRFADSLLPATPVSTWKTYLQWYIIKNSANSLSNDFVQRNFQFNKILSGQKEIVPRWQRMSALIDGSLGDLLGQLYVNTYFNPAAKQRMIELVDNLQKTFAERINNLDWMSKETKERAIMKLSAFGKKIAYTDKWKTYDGLIITRDNLLENVRRAAVWSYNDRIRRLGKPVDKTEWNFTPPTVNASYNPIKNEITFPAGILQFPFFDFKADDAVNYGGIAAVIGHEMTHGFDDQGRQFDADGNLKDWWTEADANLFKAKADKVVEQYNGFTILDTLHVNGKLTLGENIADLGGLSMAYAAFKKTPQGKSNKKIDGFTPDQRFFLGWAQVWRQNALPEFAAQLILTDPHSPGEFRTNGTVIHMDAFYKAFNVKEGDKLFVPEDKRIKIW
ncbi:MAG: metallopeptidase [Ferruginibacter sp.]|nr:metallopeptidase [Ferruginibacter sp.]